MSSPEYDQAVDDIREELGDAIMIIEEEMSRSWIPDSVANALRILVNFVKEGEE